MQIAVKDTDSDEKEDAEGSKSEEVKDKGEKVAKGEQAGFDQDEDMATPVRKKKMSKVEDGRLILYEKISKGGKYGYMPKLHASKHCQCIGGEPKKRKGFDTVEEVDQGMLCHNSVCVCAWSKLKEKWSTS